MPPAATMSDDDAFSSRYIHGSTTAEQRRLSVLNDLINEASLRELGLRGGESILDVGSGLGQFTRAMARAAGPRANVVGVERDDRQLAEAKRSAAEEGGVGRVEFRSGDARALPLWKEEWEFFDIAHARFVLEHVRDPLTVVGEMVRAVHPGGRVVLADDDHGVLRLWPEPPEFEPVWRAYIHTYKRLGTDPYVGQRLVALLHQAGATPVRNTWIFFGGCSGSPVFGALAANMIGILEGARDIILAETLIARGEFDAGIQATRAWSCRPDAALWYAICWAEGVRPLREP